MKNFKKMMLVPYQEKLVESSDDNYPELDKNVTKILRNKDLNDEDKIKLYLAAFAKHRDKYDPAKYTRKDLEFLKEIKESMKDLVDEKNQSPSIKQEDDEYRKNITQEIKNILEKSVKQEPNDIKTRKDEEITNATVRNLLSLDPNKYYQLNWSNTLSNNQTMNDKNTVSSLIPEFDLTNVSPIQEKNTKIPEIILDKNYSNKDNSSSISQVDTLPSTSKVKNTDNFSTNHISSTPYLKRVRVIRFLDRIIG